MGGKEHQWTALFMLGQERFVSPAVHTYPKAVV